MRDMGDEVPLNPGNPGQPRNPAAMPVSISGAMYGATAGLASTALLQQQAAVSTRAAHMQQAELENKLNNFWVEQMGDVEHARDFKNHLLPLARIKKIMKSDEDVRMISAEAPVLFAKACEMFILELTHRAWTQTEEAKRRTLQRSDISTAIQKTDIFDFLIDIVPRDDPHTKKEPGHHMIGPGAVPGSTSGAAIPMGNIAQMNTMAASGHTDTAAMAAAAAQAAANHQYYMQHQQPAMQQGIPQQTQQQTYDMYAAATAAQQNPQYAAAAAGYAAAGGMYQQAAMVNQQQFAALRQQQAGNFSAPNAQQQAFNHLPYLAATAGNTTEQQPPQS